MDSSLGLAFEIAADPSKGIAAVQQFSEGTTAALRALTVELEGLKTQLAEAQVRIVELEERGVTHLASQSTEATHAIRGMGEELGIHMPRFISSFISHIEGIGPILASAFSTVAIIGIVQMIAEQLPEAYDRLEEKISGWDKEAKAAYDDQIKLNERYLELVTHIEQKMIDLRVQYGLISNKQGIDETIEAKQKEFNEQQRIVNGIEQAIRYQKEYNDAVRVAAETGGLMPTAPDPRSPEELNKQLKQAQENVAKLDISLRELRSAGVAAAEAKDTETWFKNLQDGIKKTEEGKNKAAQADRERANLANQQFNEELRHYNEIRDAAAKLAQDKERLTKETADFMFNAQMDYEKRSEQLMDGELSKFEQIQKQKVKEILETAKAVRDGIKYEEDAEVENGRIWAQIEKQKQEEHRRTANSLLSSLGAMAGALRNHHAIEIGLILTRAAIRAAEEVAAALAAAAVFDYRGAALHYASAAAYVGVAGMQAFSGGGGSYGGGGASSAAPSVAGNPTNVPLAPGAMRPGGNYHIVVMGDVQGAQHIAGMLDRAVRFNGTQLTASQSLG